MPNTKMKEHILCQPHFSLIEAWKTQALSPREELIASLRIREDESPGRTDGRETWLLATTHHLFLLSFMGKTLSSEKSIPLAQVAFLVLLEEEILSLQVVYRGESELIPIAREPKEIHLKLKRLVNLINLMIKSRKHVPDQSEMLIQKLETKVAPQTIEINEATFQLEEQSASPEVDIQVSSSELEALWAPFKEFPSLSEAAEE